jgi:hypothetical protein
MSDHVAGITTAGADLADAIFAEMKLMDERHVVKMQAIDEIMASGDNPKTGKPYSFSSAEAQVESHPAYAAHLGKLREAARDRVLAKAAYDSAYVAGLLAAKN